MPTGLVTSKKYVEAGTNPRARSLGHSSVTGGYRCAISAALMPMSDRFRRLSGRLPLRSKRVALVVGVAAIVAAVALAAGVYIALEPDNGTPANGAAVAQTDSATTG